MLKKLTERNGLSPSKSRRQNRFVYKNYGCEDRLASWHRPGLTRLTRNSGTPRRANPD